MTRDLPPHATLESLRKEAKRRLKDLRAANPAAQLREAQHGLARDYGFDGWIALKAGAEDLALDRKARSEKANILLRHGWGGDASAARRIAGRDPSLSKDSLALACILGDLGEVERRLAADPASADRRDGPLDWTPLLHLAYGRLPGHGADLATVIARKLLDAGADPNASFDDGWGNAFTPLCGVIGQGEGVKPPHARAGELAALLLERGAEPYDTQALYNTAIVGDEVSWLRLLWYVSEKRGGAAQWTDPEAARRLGGRIPGLSTLDFLLGLAVGQNHLQRAAWLLEHGARAAAVHAYSGRPLMEEAHVRGHNAMAALLEAHGAPRVTLKGEAGFQAAVLAGDEALARTLLAADPDLIRKPGPLLHAAGANRVDAIDLLLNLGADPNLCDDIEATALHWAVHGAALDAARRLLEAGAEVDARETKWRGTPLTWSLVLGKPDLFAFLAPISRDVRGLVSGAALERLEAVLTKEPALANHHLEGDPYPTPLFCLPDNEDQATEAATILLRFGADRTARNAEGQTPGDVARTRGLEEAADLIGGLM